MSQPPPIPETTHGESQLDIVRRMFRRRWTAVWGLRVTMALVVLATFAPVIASGVPLVWQPPGADTEYPWFARLFDIRTWPNTLDRLFNLLMVVVTLYFVVRGVMRLAMRDKPRRLEIGRKVRKGFVIVWLLVALIQSMQWGLYASLPSVDYRRLEAQYETAGEEYTCIRTIVPYSYDEGLEGTDHKFQPSSLASSSGRASRSRSGSSRWRSTSRSARSWARSRATTAGAWTS